MLNEAAEPDEVEALMQVGMALHPDPQSPRFDVLFGPPKAGREGPEEQNWSFPGPLLRLEDIQSELQVSFSRLKRPQEQEVTLLGQLIRPAGRADLLVLNPYSRRSNASRRRGFTFKATPSRTPPGRCSPPISWWRRSAGLGRRRVVAHRTAIAERQTRQGDVAAIAAEHPGSGGNAGGGVPQGAGLVDDRLRGDLGGLHGASADQQERQQHGDGVQGPDPEVISQGGGARGRF